MKNVITVMINNESEADNNHKRSLIKRLTKSRTWQSNYMAVKHITPKQR